MWPKRRIELFSNVLMEIGRGLTSTTPEHGPILKYYGRSPSCLIAVRGQWFPHSHLPNTCSDTWAGTTTSPAGLRGSLHLLCSREYRFDGTGLKGPERCVNGAEPLVVRPVRPLRPGGAPVVPMLHQMQSLCIADWCRCNGCSPGGHTLARVVTKALWWLRP
jgi:hypothetical protein